MARDFDKIRAEKLAALSIELDAPTVARLLTLDRPLTETIVAGQIWKVTRLHYGHRDCELCGHKGIRRIFTITSNEGTNLEIGSECARQYAEADLIDALCRTFDIEYKKIVNPEKFADDIPVLEWAAEASRTLPRNIRYCYDLINGGSPTSILKKIRAGKTIGKREKEVIAYWNAVKEDVSAAEAAVEVANWLAKIGAQARYARRNQEYALRQLRYFFSALPEYVYQKARHDGRADIIAAYEAAQVGRQWNEPYRPFAFEAAV